MKNIFSQGYSLHTLVLFCACASLATVNMNAAHGQGTIEFSGRVSVYGTNYYEQGMWFRVAVQPGDYDSMGIISGNQGGNLATNGTPFMDFFRQLNPSDYVLFSLTNGYSFGLTSVYLGDPLAPSPSPVPISFIGFLSNGSTVTNTFTTPGNNANSLLNYTFTSAFASGLTSVDIFAPRWAMDNLVFTVPEPAAVSLFLLGSGICLYVRQRHQRS